MNMKKKRLLFSSVFVLSLVMTIFSIFKFGSLNKSSASVYKNVDSIQIEKGLHDVLNNGEKMYVARSSFYDYYADSEIGNSQVPHPISDAIDYSKNTMDKFNNKLLEIMKYGDPNESPAKYPLYQGRQGQNFKDSTIFSFNNNSVNEKSNYWLGANSNQIGAYATQGLVDSKLTYDSGGE